MQKVNILGTEYMIEEINPASSHKFNNANGIAELYSKKLLIDNTIGLQPDLEHENIKDYKKKVVRHEIAHAFLHESGLTEYCMDEYLVEWIAQQAPKIFKTMKEVGVLD